MKKILLIILILLFFSFSASSKILILQQSSSFCSCPDANFVSIGVSGNSFLDSLFTSTINVVDDANFIGVQATNYYGSGKGLTDITATSGWPANTTIDTNQAAFDSVQIDLNLMFSKLTDLNSFYYTQADINAQSVPYIGATTDLNLGIYGIKAFDSNFTNTEITGNLWADFLQTGLNEPTGFPNKCSDVIISFTDGTNTFSIQPSGASFDIFHSGIKFTKTVEETIELTDDEGVHYIYYDSSGTLQEIVTPTTAEVENILENEVIVAALYWNTTADQNIYFTGTNECHGTQMDGSTHAHLHFSTGTLFQSGLAVGDIVANDTGDGATHAQLSVTDGIIDDEDILQAIVDDTPQNLSAPANLPIFYRSGTSDWKKITATDYIVTTTGSGRAAWNEFTGGVWQLTEVTNNQFVLFHVFATNNFFEPVVVIIGQSDYATLTLAREGSAAEINNLVTSGIGFQEFVPLATGIVQTSNGYANAVKSRIRTTDLGDDYIDWRFQQISPSVVPGDHGNLAGLADNDHQQYVLNTGDRITGDLNGEYDLNFFNILARGDINGVGDVNFGGSLSIFGTYYGNGLGLTNILFSSLSLDTNSNFDARYCLLSDSNNASRLDYVVIANPPYIPTKADIDANASALLIPDSTLDLNTTANTAWLGKAHTFTVTQTIQADLNITQSGTDNGISIEPDLNRIWIGEMYIDYNGTGITIGG